MKIKTVLFTGTTLHTRDEGVNRVCSEIEKDGYEIIKIDTDFNSISTAYSTYYHIVTTIIYNTAITIKSSK